MSIRLQEEIRATEERLAVLKERLAQENVRGKCGLVDFYLSLTGFSGWVIDMGKSMPPWSVKITPAYSSCSCEEDDMCRHIEFIKKKIFNVDDELLNSSSYTTEQWERFLGWRLPYAREIYEAHSETSAAIEDAVDATSKSIRTKYLQISQSALREINISLNDKAERVASESLVRANDAAEKEKEVTGRNMMMIRRSRPA